MNYRRLYEQIKDADDKLAAANAPTRTVNPGATPQTWGEMVVAHGAAQVAQWELMVDALIEDQTHPVRRKILERFNSAMNGGGVRVGDAQVRSDIEAMAPMVGEDAKPLIDLLLSKGETQSSPAKDALGREATQTDVTKAMLIGQSIKARDAVIQPLAAKINDAEGAAALAIEAIEQWDGEGDPPAAYTGE